MSVRRASHCACVCAGILGPRACDAAQSACTNIIAQITPDPGVSVWTRKLAASINEKQLYQVAITCNFTVFALAICFLYGRFSFGAVCLRKPRFDQMCCALQEGSRIWSGGSTPPAGAAQISGCSRGLHSATRGRKIKQKSLGARDPTPLGASLKGGKLLAQNKEALQHALLRFRLVWRQARTHAPLSPCPSCHASLFQLTHLISVDTGHSEP